MDKLIERVWGGFKHLETKKGGRANSPMLFSSSGVSSILRTFLARLMTSASREAKTRRASSLAKARNHLQKPGLSLVTFLQHMELASLCAWGRFSKDNKHNMKQGSLQTHSEWREQQPGLTHGPDLSEEGRSPRSFIFFAQFGDIFPSNHSVQPIFSCELAGLTTLVLVSLRNPAS